jgi:hypothetical protein
MPSPLTHTLLPAACAWSSGRATLTLDARQWKRFGFLCLFLGNTPDLDLIPAGLFPSLYYEIHRAWGHNGFSLALWTILGAVALRKWVSPVFRGARGYLFSAALVLSHVVLDGSGQIVPGQVVRRGVPVLWPFSDWELVTPFEIFGGYLPLEEHHPLFAHLFTPGFWKTLFGRELVAIALVSAVSYLTSRLYRSLRKPRASTSVLASEAKQPSS